MSDVHTFRREQTAVAVRMLGAVTASVLVLSAAAMVTWSGRADGLTDRLRWLTGAWMCLGVWLAATIASVARLRFFSPDDIAGSSSGSASPSVRTANASLQNTLEQVVLAAFSYAGLAMTLPRPGAVLVAAAVLFSVGRALFWAGLSRGAAHRALGFGLTFYPSLIALALSLFLAVWLVTT